MFGHIETILFFSLTIIQSFILFNVLSSQFNTEGLIALIISIILSFIISSLEVTFVHKLINKKQ